jgi:hypothetical protein
MSAVIRFKQPTAEKPTVMQGRGKNAAYRSREYLTEGEIEKLLTAAGKSRNANRDRLLVLMAYRHALRVKELVDLHVDQIDLKAATIRRFAPVTFVPGMQRVPGSGRKAGTPNRRTQLMRDRLQSAMATFRDSPRLVEEVTDFLRGVAGARTKGMTPEQIAALPREELMLLQSFMVEAAKIALKAMEYSYPRISRIDPVGDAPMVNLENRMVVELKIGESAPPMLPNAEVIEHDGAAAGLPHSRSSGDTSPSS